MFKPTDSHLKVITSGHFPQPSLFAGRCKVAGHGRSSLHFSRCISVYLTYLAMNIHSRTPTDGGQGPLVPWEVEPAGESSPHGSRRPLKQGHLLKPAPTFGACPYYHVCFTPHYEEGIASPFAEDSLLTHQAETSMISNQVLYATFERCRCA